MARADQVGELAHGGVLGEGRQAGGLPGELPGVHPGDRLAGAEILGERGRHHVHLEPRRRPLPR
ncbi:hypothetical protein [Streptosporangium nondiastaticum]|uniref:hypothetical protein n=1 Tax=Streptosporangium nondiastaticum TaxID=35764 RepID=UPI0031F9C153